MTWSSGPMPAVAQALGGQWPSINLVSCSRIPKCSNSVSHNCFWTTATVLLSYHQGQSKSFKCDPSVQHDGLDANWRCADSGNQWLQLNPEEVGNRACKTSIADSESKVLWEVLLRLPMRQFKNRPKLDVSWRNLLANTNFSKLLAWPLQWPLQPDWTSIQT